MRANLWLRAASRVVVRVAQFPATAFFELEKRARRVPWPEYVAPGTQPRFRVTAHKSRLYHSDAIAERLERSVARAVGGSAAGAEGAAEQLFVVRVDRDVVSISADTSGALLHLRGYRQAVAKAPLRETLAAALLLACGWDGTEPLLDPFCGSGTIPIEGALIARGMAPGLRRDFAFMRWPTFYAPAWTSLRAEARAAAKASSSMPIVGSDRDAGAIAGARANAERAGVEVTFDARPISAVTAPAESGLVATNPPYGMRVGDRPTIRNLYARFGDVLRDRFAGWRVAMYAADERVAGHSRLPMRRLLRTTNGGVPITALTADQPG